MKMSVSVKILIAACYCGSGAMISLLIWSHFPSGKEEGGYLSERGVFVSRGSLSGRAGGHPTGMLSCFCHESTDSFLFVKKVLCKCHLFLL